MSISILVHTCCAPCATASVEKLLSEGEEPYLFFYNPNIHPFQEFKARLESFEAYLASSGLKGQADPIYGLDGFISGLEEIRKPSRCGYCYALRLERAAWMAKELGILKFTTTLTISPYQDHEMLRKAGMLAGEKYGVEFVYHDFRGEYRKSRQMAREAGFYMQKYCGCVFSEADRFDPARGG